MIRRNSTSVNCLMAVGVWLTVGLIAYAEPVAKKLLLLMAAIGLAGCGTVSFVSSQPTAPAPVVAAKAIVPALPPAIKRVEVPAVVAPLKESTPLVVAPQPKAPDGESYQYGRFLVEVAKDGTQKVVGGEFTPAVNTPIPATEHCAIFINYSTKELTSYCKNAAGVYIPIVGYAVVTPLSEALPKEVVHGVVKEIIRNPSWCPTKDTRKLYPHLKPGCVPYGDPTNPMGIVKYIIAWNIHGYEYVRLHGSDGYPKGKFWEVETLGCTALENAGAAYLTDELTKKLGGVVKDRIGVYLMKGDSVGTLKKDGLDAFIHLIGKGG